VNENGFVPVVNGLTVPAPFSVIVTLVALPPKVLALIVTAVVPHVLPLLLLSETDGGFAHPHDTEKLTPVVVHPDGFLTVIVWLPLATLVKEVPLWNEPTSRLYSRPAPVGLVTVTTALPKPSAQSVVCAGLAGDDGCALITTLADAAEIHPAELVTI
jgi:hypothetical protein